MTSVQQELIPWGDGWPLPIDCFTTFVNLPDGPEPLVMHNDRFMKEVSAVKRMVQSAHLILQA
jgi:hypothetical protein